MCDIKKLPFREDFVDLLFCLGVLHHLPTPALDEVRAIKKFSPKLLIYLYYSLDNCPFYFHLILLIVTWLRLITAFIRNPIFRSAFSTFGAVAIYFPLIWFGTFLRPLGLSKYIPLYDYYQNKSLERVRQDVYDRFFTRIEQRFSKKQIMTLKDTFSKIVISEKLPFWHFVCER